MRKVLSLKKYKKALFIIDINTLFIVYFIGMPTPRGAKRGGAYG